MSNNSDHSGFVMVDKAPTETMETEAVLSFSDRIDAARNFVADEQFTDARILLQEALRMRPNDSLARAMLGYCIAAQDPCSLESLPLCETAARTSRRPEILYYLGKVHLLHENRRKAIQVFEEGIRADPRYVPIHAELDRIGRRKAPVISFLPRDHALNVSLGRWLSRRGRR